MKLFLNSHQTNPVNSFLLTLNSKFSVQTYFYRISLFCDFYFDTRDFNQCDWSKLDRIAVLEFMRFESNNDKAHTTINLSLSTIKNIAYECWQQSIIDVDCYMKIKQIKKYTGTRAPSGRVLDAKEINKIKKYFTKNKTNKDLRNKALFALAIGAGLRRRELLLLNISDIKNKCVVVNGKGNKSRTIHLSTFALNAVLKLISILPRTSGALFSKINKLDDITSSRISSMGVGCIINQIQDNCKIEHFTPHDLRRTFATTLLDVGADTLAVQKLMGHASLNTTSIYDRRGDKTQKTTIELLPF